MAKQKPVIRRCIFCFERFLDQDMLKHKQPDGSCKHTSRLLQDGWTQTPTGYWEKK